MTAGETAKRAKRRELRRRGEPKATRLEIADDSKWQQVLLRLWTVKLRLWRLERLRIARLRRQQMAAGTVKTVDSKN